MALRDAGWRVVNLACGLGGEGQRARREAELREACRLARFELRIPAKPALASTEEGDAVAVGEVVAAAIAELDPQLVVSPGPGDRHPAHGLVAAAARKAIEGQARPVHWWAWALWGSLPQPTLGTLFEQERLEEVLVALAAHRGELERNDYRRFVRARAEMNVSLAAELLFGFGAAAPAGARYAELLTEAVPVDGRWRLGEARWLDPAAALRGPTRTAAAF